MAAARTVPPGRDRAHSHDFHLGSARTRCRCVGFLTSAPKAKRTSALARKRTRDLEGVRARSPACLPQPQGHRCRVTRIWRASEYTFHRVTPRPPPPDPTSRWHRERRRLGGTTPRRKPGTSHQDPFRGEDASSGAKPLWLSFQLTNPASPLVTGRRLRHYGNGAVIGVGDPEAASASATSAPRRAAHGETGETSPS